MARFYDSIAALFVVLCLFTGATTVAQAASFDDAISQFTNDFFADTEAAIAAVAASGHPMASRVIGALQQGQLLFDAASRRVVIKDGSNLIDAATGERVSEPATSFAPVRLNNRLRRSRGGGARRPDAAVAGSRYPAGSGAIRFQIA